MNSMKRSEIVILILLSIGFTSMLTFIVTKKVESPMEQANDSVNFLIGLILIGLTLSGGLYFAI